MGTPSFRLYSLLCDFADEQHNVNDVPLVVAVLVGGVEVEVLEVDLARNVADEQAQVFAVELAVAACVARSPVFKVANERHIHFER